MQFLLNTISRLKSLIGKAAVPAAFSAQNAENASHTEPLRALWRYENLYGIKGFHEVLV
jgi:hypothetical protein